MKQLLFVLVFLALFCNENIIIAQTCPTNPVNSLSLGTSTENGGVVTVDVLLNELPTEIIQLTTTIEFSNDTNVTINTSTTENSLNSNIPDSETSWSYGTSGAQEVTMNFTDFFGTPINFSTNPAVLFTISFTVAGTASTTLSFSASSGDHRIVLDGFTNCNPLTGSSVTYTPPSYEISGSVEKLSQGTDLPDVTFTARPVIGSNVIDISDSSGAFDLTGLEGGKDYTVTGAKTGIEDCGVSETDISETQKHILETESFTQVYEYIAADANGSLTLTTFDLVVTRKTILGQSGGIFQSWVIMPGSEYVGLSLPANFSTVVPSYSEEKEFNNISQDFSFEFFQGIKVGDVTVNCSNLSGTLQDENPVVGRSEKKIRLGNIRAEENSEVLIPVYAPDFRNQTLFSLGLQFDTDKIDLLGVSTGMLPEFDENCYTVNLHEEGTLDILWFSNAETGQTLAANQPLFYINVRTKERIQNAQGLINMQYNRVQNKMFTLFDNDSDVSIEISDDNPAINIGEGQNYSNDPEIRVNNPFQDRLQFLIDATQATNATLELMDINGNILFSEKLSLFKGKNNYQLEDTARFPDGYLIYRINFPEKAVSGKILKLGN